MFQKKIDLNTLDEMIFQLDDHDFTIEDVRDKADTTLFNRGYQEYNSMRKTLVSELTTTFKAYHVPHAELKQEIRNKLERFQFIGGERYIQDVVAFYYLLLMLLSHKNVPPMVATLSNFKKESHLFTLKIFLKLLPAEAKQKAHATVYQQANQFLMQLEHFGFLNKVSVIYAVRKGLNLNWEQQDFARRVINELPKQYRQQLSEVFELENQEQETAEAV